MKALEEKKKRSKKQQQSSLKKFKIQFDWEPKIELKSTSSIINEAVASESSFKIANIIETFWKRQLNFYFAILASFQVIK